LIGLDRVLDGERMEVVAGLQGPHLFGAGVGDPYPHEL
jgi:hypothetical protein